LLPGRRTHIVLLILISFFATAQNGLTDHPRWQIKPSFNQGFILVHRISIGHLVKGYPAIYEVNVSKPTLGDQLWQVENNKPDIGLSFQCIDFKNPSQLGYAFSLAPYVEIPLNKTERLSRLILRLCFGATYITKSFDIRTNHKNIAIGSPVNAYVQFKWFWHLPINKNLRFEPGFSFSHASNGRYKNPNLGLNVVSINAALNFLLPSKKVIPPVTSIDSSTKVRSRHEIMTVAAIGFNERQLNTKGLHTYILSGAYQYNIRNTHKFSFGTDIFLDEIYNVDYENEYNKKLQGAERIRVSARAGYSYNVGKISFPIELGYYVYEAFNPDARIVSRIGVRYYGSNGFIGHFGLRTHFAVAYNFEYGVGYRFYIK